MILLLTGFEPFGDHPENPTERLVRSLDRNEFKNVILETAILPVVFDKCVVKLMETVAAVRPDAVICCGLAAGRAAVTVERIGINVKDVGDGTARRDNRGAEPHGEPIVPGGPDGLFATIPVEQIVRNIKHAEIPAEISNTAGTYICNNTLYGILYQVRERQLPIRAGFIHFPATPELAQRPEMPCMPHGTMKKALEIAIQTVAASTH
ncbi:pyroglutamyl-peptidase I [Paenibacillus alkalitolerans]|uniref:pyroglutamyl-peptidase I n=1 Tax=Paenibacillus alkalitolerans TaxID=2799335 RepID=UPI002D80F497|nr:pyroglutamyl-peptidase I [Paenibacillus alkalitolerans]